MTVVQLDLFRSRSGTGEAAHREGAGAPATPPPSPVPTPTWVSKELHPSKRVHDPDTSVQPSEPAMSKGRLKVLAAHYLHPDGLTDFECADLVGSQQTSAGVRRKELERAGLIVATTKRRPSPSGKPVIVWRITSQGVGFIVRLNEQGFQP